MTELKHVLSILFVLAFVSTKAQKLNEYFVDSTGKAMDINWLSQK